MKKLTLLLVSFTLLLTACQGDPGPQGPPGFDGQDGTYIVGQSFETLPLDFSSGNNYEQSIQYPSNLEILDTDMILVYLRWNLDNNDPPTWRLLPQTIYTQSGEFQYNFQDDFTHVTIFMDFSSGFNFNDLISDDTNNQVFKVIVLPVDLINNINLDVTNYHEVMEFVQP